MSWLLLLSFRGSEAIMADPITDQLEQGKRYVFIPCGTYQIDSTIEILSEVIIEGESMKCVTILFDRDITAIRNYAHFTQIKNLTLQGRNPALSGGDAIENRQGRTVFQNLDIKHPGRHGIYVNGQMSLGIGGNANLSRYYNIRIDQAESHGLFVDGSDANVCHFENMDVTHSGGWGIYDDGFLGNTYLTCHTSSNELGGYKTTNLHARHTIVGCYAEDGQANEFNCSATILGGFMNEVWRDCSDPFDPDHIDHDIQAMVFPTVSDSDFRVAFYSTGQRYMITLVDTHGRTISNLLNRQIPEGVYQMEFHSPGVTGEHYIIIRSGNESSVLKITII